MKRNGLWLVLATAAITTACGDGTALPEPTGKATVRGINAIKGSPSIEFLIEERTLANIGYQGISNPNQYDDFTYNFNFEVRFAGDSEDTRIATRQIDFTAGADYTLVLTGSLASPTVNVWESVEREFGTDDTVFQARFAHTSTTWGDIDVYMAPDGTTPVPGEQVATLSFGDITAPADFENGEYAITVTVAKNPGETIAPADILYTSLPTTIASQADLIIAPFDGNADTVAPVLVRLLNATGASFTLPDPQYEPTQEFVHGAFDAGDVDVYDDETLMSQIVAGLTFGQQTADITATVGTNTYRFTPAGDPTQIFESEFIANSGLRYRHYVLGSDGSYRMNSVIRRPSAVDTGAKVSVYQTSSNFNFLNFYTVEPGGAFEDALPFLLGLGSGVGTEPVILEPGAYDIYVSETGESDILAGPLPVDIVTGGYLDLVVFDTVDPAVLELRVMN